MNNVLVNNSKDILSSSTTLTADDQEMINSFLEDKEFEAFDEDQIARIVEILENIWARQKYGIDDALLFANVIDILLHCEPQFIKKLSEHMNIILTPKDLKRGKYAVLQRIIKRYHNKRIRDQFTKFLSFHNQKEIHRFKAEPTATIDDLVGEKPFETILWIVKCHEQSDEAFAYIRRNFAREYAYSLWYCLITYIGMEYETIMDRPNELSQTQSVDNTNKLSHIQAQNKKLQKNLKKSEERTSQLQQTVAEKAKNEKLLKGQMEALYEDALKETEELRRQLEELRRKHEEETVMLLDMFQEERDFYQQEIQMLRQSLSSQNDDEVKENDLEGQTIAVIGGNRERHYRDIIERYNGRILFVPEDQPGLVHSSVKGSDAVFFLKGLVGHDHLRDAMDAAKAADIAFVYVNTKGVSTFERKLVQYMKQDKLKGYRIS
ncbi:DUF2325 domain-containing protein [Paenibacillus sp. Y412MC10]|uniref:DUF2325 domain-containing protein n=1 Tax=Geobacillus sp. (strain Y412MC10) TaxID=481743 RepID=UPI0011AB388F|nr:DUF2325 domain-containing protein [Paenibacillus sp. Y412MC10]